ncbi:hypothetical protein PIROE2DRAFT_6961 [Piromyces sp. E2]|nr:hypothetical protein PIROE2DRAFT_6961 [Piromyces sp. E2]|eukprot:OUM65971.1 hypothetical protein PIROE2DRAFT_6961 [Piromyces sp. E2]
MEEWSTNNNIIGSKYQDIRVIFDEEKYNISPYGRNHFTIYKSLILYSEKGSVLDFGDSPQSSLRFHFVVEEKNQKLIFKNLTFKNYRGITEITDHLITFSVVKDKNNIYIEFENCNFIDIYGYLLNVDITFKQSVTDSPQVLFKNCSFLNTHMLLNIRDKRIPKINSISFFVKYENCYFENFSIIGDVSHGIITYDNCHFTKGNGLYRYPCTFINAQSNQSKIKIINSIIEDINLITNKPFFIINESSLQLINTKFKNCHTPYGFLISSKVSNKLTKENVDIMIDNCEFDGISIYNFI